MTSYEPLKARSPSAVRYLHGRNRYRWRQRVIRGNFLRIFSGFPLMTSLVPTPPPLKFLSLSWNVVDNKGPEMRIVRIMRLPWNVTENKELSSIARNVYDAKGVSAFCCEEGAGAGLA